MFVDSLQFSMAGRGQTWGCEAVQSLIEIWSDDHIKSQLSKTHKNSAVFSLFSNPRSCLSIIAVCCLMHFTPVFVYFREHRWNFPARQSKSSLGNAFKDTSSQQVKQMLSRDCILVRFSWFGPEQTVGCEKEPKWLKIATMYNFLLLVRTK